jgi:uncharacterized protein YpuA (DUF1002 family)
LTNEKYNGWTNRETWLVNLHFGDSFDSIIREEAEDSSSSDLAEAIEVIKADEFADEQSKNQEIGDVIQDIADRYKEFFEEMIYEDINGLSSFILDYIDFSLINWFELARDIYQDLI